MQRAEVALPLPVDHAFTYVVPDTLAAAAVAGARVLVPFGSRKLLGVIVEVRAPSDRDQPRLLPISEVVDADPVLPRELLAFVREVARYYLAPLGEVVALAVPALDRRSASRLRDLGLKTPGSQLAPAHLRRLVRLVDVGHEETAAEPRGPKPRRPGPVAEGIVAHLREHGEAALRDIAARWPTAHSVVRRLVAAGVLATEDRAHEVAPFSEIEARDVAPALTSEQARAVEAIAMAVRAAGVGAASGTRAGAFLVHGVTGSGKTEVYLRAIEATLSVGRGALVLVPEIALTPQLVGRFRARFGDGVAVVHSALDRGARHAMWRRLHAGELRVAIGARSALFSPVPNLGLVVVDEEHDPSFKQEDGVRYHARDCALLRAHRAGAVCVLGSATPSLESLELSRQGKVTKLLLLRRARAQSLPEVEIIDLRRVGPGPTGSRLVSLPLHRALEATLAAGEQSILFLNRRGFAPAIRCEACGIVRECPDCDVALTFHGRSGARPRRDGTIEPIPAGMRCHYCDRVEPLLRACPACGGTLVLEGIGTERLEETLAQAFPRARVARLDRDVASGKEVEAILRRMRAREIDVLVGTQMVAKGHDLPFVTLVGVVNADSALSMPDFRASERTFHLLVQVAGRAGRGDAKGRVLIQTRTPEHSAIACAAHHDIDAFVARELADREEVGYPPFSRLVLVRLEGPVESEVLAAASALARAARAASPRGREGQGANEGEPRVLVLGPTPAPIPRVRGRYRYRILLRGDRPDVRVVARAVRAASAELGRMGGEGRRVRIVIDIDPLSMM